MGRDNCHRRKRRPNAIVTSVSADYTELIVWQKSMDLVAAGLWVHESFSS
jgi:hypothetical protein